MNLKDIDDKSLEIDLNQKNNSANKTRSIINEDEELWCYSKDDFMQKENVFEKLKHDTEIDS